MLYESKKNIATNGATVFSSPITIIACTKIQDNNKAYAGLSPLDPFMIANGLKINPNKLSCETACRTREAPIRVLKAEDKVEHSTPIVTKGCHTLIYSM
jgi:hypothetical protein